MSEENGQNPVQGDDSLKEKSSWGGRRPGAGRKEGSKNKATIEQKEAERQFKERIMENLYELVTAQMNIAKGASYMYRIDEEKSSKGTVLSKKHVLVTDPQEIQDVLDELEGTGVMDDHYYYITTQAPDNRAIDSLLNRVFGKPKQSIDMNVAMPQNLIDLIKHAKSNASTSPELPAGDTQQS